ncbi:MAG: hypothetical protein QXR59_04810 [Candidatus Bathyarchaeia archaeon]
MGAWWRVEAASEVKGSAFTVMLPIKPTRGVGGTWYGSQNQ